MGRVGINDLSAQKNGIGAAHRIECDPKFLFQRNSAGGDGLDERDLLARHREQSQPDRRAILIVEGHPGGVVEIEGRVGVRVAIRRQLGVDGLGGQKKRRNGQDGSPLLQPK